VSAVATALARATGTLGLVVSLASLGCGADRRTPPAAPVLASPLDAVPPDLDWVVRVDVGRVHATLGKAFVATLRTKALAERSEGGAVFLLDALERARVVVIAARHHEGRFSDFVLALEGEFRGLDPRAYPAQPPWQPPIDLGRDVRRYDRAKPAARSDPMRLYLRSNELVVAASEAELDSVEAVIERGAPPNPLRPRERGFLSAAFRLRELSVDRFPELARALAGVRGMEGFVDTSGDGFRVEATTELASDAHAKQAAEFLETVRAAFEGTSGKWAALARNTTIEAQGALVVVRANLVGEALGNLAKEVFE
jgi:hypothetical protein